MQKTKKNERLLARFSFGVVNTTNYPSRYP